MTRTLMAIVTLGLLMAGCQAAEIGDILRIPPIVIGPRSEGAPVVPTGPAISLAPGTTGVFLYVEGVEGGVTSESLKGWINATDWEFIAEMAVARLGEGGRTAGRASSGPLVIVKQIDVASPKLFELCATGHNVPRVDLVVANNGQLRLHIAMEAVMVVRVGRLLADGDPANTERVHLSAERVRWDVPQYAPDGQMGPVISAGWDFVANRAW